MRERISLCPAHQKELRETLALGPFKTFVKLPPQYKIGTEKEQASFLDALIKAQMAVASGNFSSLEKNTPDFLCQRCLNPECSTSGIEKRDLRNKVLAEVRETLSTLEEAQGEPLSALDRHRLTLSMGRIPKESK